MCVLFLVKILSLDSVDFRFFYVVCLLLFMTQQYPIVCLCGQCLSVGPLMDIGLFPLWLSQVKLLRTFMCKILWTCFQLLE